MRSLAELRRAGVEANDRRHRRQREPRIDWPAQVARLCYGHPVAKIGYEFDRSLDSYDAASENELNLTSPLKKVLVPT